MAKYITDPQGAHWPVSGFWCRVCRWPLHAAVVAEGYTTHPGCEVTS